MTISNKISLNFSGGEVDPSLLSGRIDIPLYSKVVSRMENFIAEPHGPARYRPGTRYVHHTRNNNPGVLIEFQFSDIQSYLVEATEGYFRFYKDEGIILNSTALTITDITSASPGVVTYTGTDPEEGEEVYITGVNGMTEVNGRFFTITNLNTGAKTFELYDEFGSAIDTSGYTAYDSAGSAAQVYEIKTPYREADLETLEFAQKADLMYITHNNYEPRKLTRTDHDAWTLSRYTRTSDPFATDNVTWGTITGITQANPGVFTDAAHTWSVDDLVYVSGVGGMTEVNDRHFKINTVGAGTFTLKDVDTGTPLDTSGYTAFSSNGIVEKIESTTYPAAVGFTDGTRLAMAGTLDEPEAMWFSRAPTSAGATRFDDFTTGSNPEDSMKFVLAPLQDGKVDSIRWLMNTDKYIAVGTFGSIRRVFGATEGAVVEVDAITAKSANSDGVAKAKPVVDGATVLYIGRSGLSVESIEYDYTVDGYKPQDRNLVSPHMTVGGLKHMRRQVGRPTLIWDVRNDGVLLALTYNARENVAGWHRHKIADGGLVKWVGVMPRETNRDQLWTITQRTVNENTVRYVEFFTDPPDYPDEIDFYTGNDAKGLFDRERFWNYQFEINKDSIHLDASLTYNGNQFGVDASASITLGQDADEPLGQGVENVTVTASANVFTSDMVGREIWGKYTTEGIGGGRIEITGFTSATEVTGTILDTFPSEAEYAAGDWFITATSVSGLDHLEQKSVGVVADGGYVGDSVVEDGAITLDSPASVIHIGLRYRGLIRTLPLDQGGITGPAQYKPKSVSRFRARFANSSRIFIGTNLYHLTPVEFAQGDDLTDRPTALKNGVADIIYEDDYENDKIAYIVQEDPLPCVITGVDMYMDTANDN